MRNIIGIDIGGSTTEKIFQKPVFVTDYPKEIKAFYMRRNDDGKTVAACDMLVPGIGEMTGGSQREERLDVLEGIMKENHLDPETYWWYLELRKYGSTKHSGFGIGFERLVMYLTGIANIRDVLPFPRTVGSAEFGSIAPRGGRRKVFYAQHHRHRHRRQHHQDRGPAGWGSDGGRPGAGL